MYWKLQTEHSYTVGSKQNFHSLQVTYRTLIDCKFQREHWCTASSKQNIYRLQVTNSTFSFCSESSKQNTDGLQVPNRIFTDCRFPTKVYQTASGKQNIHSLQDPDRTFTYSKCHEAHLHFRVKFVVNVGLQIQNSWWLPVLKTSSKQMCKVKRKILNIFLALRCQHKLLEPQIEKHGGSYILGPVSKNP